MSLKAVELAIFIYRAMLTFSSIHTEVIHNYNNYTSVPIQENNLLYAMHVFQGHIARTSHLVNSI